ncbi:MFS transporter [Aliidiomarina iranensis]|uniref:MFS transporter n=1 Tax=Aliidiomarina iranensis TaxID=1434071 RepID=A0A432VQG8_9GAMM|nr:VC0807 family protein [Aliidiomarina iranensis]RUO18417.1 MFS transporter [Aliidiomarina iranensis]
MSNNRKNHAEQDIKEPGLMVNMLFNIFLPVIILMQLSSEARLGAATALVLALAFPIGFGLWELYRRKKINGFSILGLVSVLLTGGIGLLELDPAYIAIKEAAVPGIIGLVVFGSRFTRFPVVEKILLNRKILDLDKLYAALERRQKSAEFQRTINNGGNAVACAFFLSATLNYILARMIVVSPAGTEAFNSEIGRMTALSFPVIALPTMIILMGAIFYIFKRISTLTGESVETFLQAQDN